MLAYQITGMQGFLWPDSEPETKQQERAIRALAKAISDGAKDFDKLFPMPKPKWGRKCQ